MPLARDQRRLAVIVAIDVVGYSRLMGRNESGTHALLKIHLAERVGPSITRRGGRVVKLTGDGALAEFDSAVNALSAVIELRQAMADANRDQPEADRIVFRAGIHLGDVIVEDDDLYGDDVNIAVRLQGESPARQYLDFARGARGSNRPDQGRASRLGRTVSQEHRATDPCLPRGVAGG
jgi:class 3 adenylate cyclase